MYVSEPSTDGHLENILEHAQDVSLWVAVEICSASSMKVIIYEQEIMILLTNSLDMAY